MKQTKGQTTVEMALLLPLFAMLIGGGIFLVYSCWQGIKVQQAANFAARVQGQERVAGGVSPGDIEANNGPTAGVNTQANQNLYGFSGPVDQTAPVAVTPSGTSLSGRISDLVRKLFPEADSNHAYIQPPVIGQNIDTVNVVRILTMPRIPLLNDKGANPQITIQGTAYGGEDTFMYGLPRWGTVSKSGNAEWKDLTGPKTDHD